MPSDTDLYGNTEQNGEQSRWGCVIGSVLFAMACAVGGYYYWHQQSQREALAALTASSGRLTLENDEGDALTVIDPSQPQAIWYRVMLEDPPLGRKLSLVCEWIDPNGNVAHRNRYETKEITRSPWQTHARYQFPSDSPSGRWQVRLILDDRELHSLAFDVRKGDQ